MTYDEASTKLREFHVHLNASSKVYINTDRQREQAQFCAREGIHNQLAYTGMQQEQVKPIVLYADTPKMNSEIIKAKHASSSCSIQQAGQCVIHITR
jgi:hypothetical protein